MNAEIDAAITILAKKSTSTEIKAGEAMQLTQAALNLAHTAATLQIISSAATPSEREKAATAGLPAKSP